MLATLPGWLTDGLRHTVQRHGEIDGIEYLQKHWTGKGWVRMQQQETRSLEGSPVKPTLTLMRAIHMLRTGLA